jgi:hypothetical protein
MMPPDVHSLSKAAARTHWLGLVRYRPFGLKSAPPGAAPLRSGQIND